MSRVQPETENGPRPEEWRADESVRLRFLGRGIEPGGGRVRLDYELDGMALQESFRLPLTRQEPACPEAVDAALDLLHWTAGISYWKAGCPENIEFADRRPGPWQAAWLERLYREGLAEFAWRNGLAQEAWAVFPPDGAAAAGPPAARCRLPRKSLVPMGGGKDSLVALERLRAAEEPLTTVQVGQAALIRQVAEAAGTEHLVVERRVDPALAELNRRGAWNGHVPITAINAAAMILLAVCEGFDRIVFANERSADEATLHDATGRPVNHQFSKSWAFESMLAEWVERCITPDLAVFSLLRRDRELGVCREFAGLTRHHRWFSSCNRNFHLDGARTERWCGDCPKCRFVFLALAPFLAPSRLSAIFGANLLDDPAQRAGFRELLALDGHKPFECVGEADEARAALAAIANDPAWQASSEVRALAPLLQGLPVPSLADLCRPGGLHRIPSDLRAHA